MIELVEKQKKGLLLALCALFISCACFAQDIIITKDSKKIKAKVVRIDVDNVRYKDFDNQNGASLTILKTNVASILYENGEVETFDNEQNPTVSTIVADNSGTNLNMATADGKATVYIIRNSSIGSLIRMGVECNDLKIGSTKAKQYVYTVLAPGNYTFVSKTPENKASLDLTLEAGKIYYIKQQVKMGIIAARTGLELMNEPDGKKALNDCKLSSDNIYVASESSENNGDLQVSQATIYSNPASVQNNEDKSLSNGTLEILTINIPDSIVFKCVEGKISKKSNVYACLVYNGKEIAPEKIVADPVLIKLDTKGSFTDVSYTDETKFYARNFNVNANARIEKIKFVVDGATMFYNLEKSKWE